MKKLHCYLRTHRRRAGFTEKELAELLGLNSGTAVSRLERCKRRPTLRCVLALQAIFGVSPADLFPGLYDEVEDAVMRHAHGLNERLKEKGSRKAKAKRLALAEISQRANERHREKEA